MNIPAPVLVCIAILAAIQGFVELLTADEEFRLLLQGAFVPAPWSTLIGLATPDQVIASAQAGGVVLDGADRLILVNLLAEMPRVWSPLTYSLLHGSWSHLGLNCLGFVVFGSAVFRRSDVVSAFLLWAVAAVGGAVAQWSFDPTAIGPLIGASASVTGFIAAAGTFAFDRPGAGRWAFLRNRAALAFLALVLGSNLATGLILVPLGWIEANVAWPSHIGGLLVGVFLYPLLKTGRQAS